MSASRYSRALGAFVLGLSLGACSTERAPEVKPQGTVGGSGKNRSAACLVTGAGPAGEMQLASCLAVAPLPPATSNGQAAPVELFVDRSASMRGFLDPNYPTTIPTDYRSVLDRMIVSIHPQAAYSFGSSIRAINPNLGLLGNGSFYTDTDTKLEDVLLRVSADTQYARSYLVLTDGRRGTPAAAEGQYAGMRTLAMKWVQAGGSFIVAASMAPFETVPSDPSGCQKGTVQGARQSCPLYAFAFVAPGGARTMAEALAPNFEHLFVWPLIRPAPDQLSLEPSVPPSAFEFGRRWVTAPDGAPVVLARAQAPIQEWLTARITLRDSTSPAGRAATSALQGQRMHIALSSKSFTPAAKEFSWQPVTPGKGIIRATPDTSLALDLVSLGPTGNRSIYRVDLVASGEPSWLEAFNAQSASDRVRTYGLGRLFEPFRSHALALSATDSAVVARFFVVAN